MQDSINSGGESQQSPQPPNEQLGTIYLLTNKINGKQYVGKTKRSLEKRIVEHKRNDSKGGSAIEVAIQKYGWENFTVEILETCPVEKMDERERHFIKALGTKSPDGYNLTDGGEGLSNPSPETRAKMSAHRPDIRGEKNPNYGKKTPPEVCAKISKANKGKPSPRKGKTHSEETRDKIAAKAKGRPSPRKGKKLSEETIAKISAAKKGKPGTPHSPESKAKISVANKGKPSPLKGKKRSPEFCAKVAAGKKAWWAKKKLESQNQS